MVGDITTSAAIEFTGLGLLEPLLEVGSGFADCLAATDALSAVETWIVWSFIGCVVLGVQGGER